MRTVWLVRQSARCGCYGRNSLWPLACAQTVCRYCCSFRLAGFGVLSLNTENEG